jgi:ABC-type lipoprotein release transport system permease subunit
MFNLLTFILKRAARHWQILATLALGVILATALLASGPVLVNTVVEFGLRRTLLSGGVLDGNVRVTSFSMTTFDPADYQAYDEAIQGVLVERLGDYSHQIVRSGNSWAFLPWLNEQLLGDERVSVGFYGGHVTGAAEDDTTPQLEFVEGGWPETVLSQTGEEQPIVAVVIGEEMAEAYELEVGDHLPLSLENGQSEADTWLEIAGIARPLDLNDPYWFGELSPLRSQRSERYSAQYTALVPADLFFPVIAAIAPEKRPELNWNTIIRPETIRFTNIPDLQAALSTLNNDLRPVEIHPAVHTDLNDMLATFVSQSAAIRPPLIFLTAEIVLLALYYVTMVAALAARQVEREFAVLTSRGATTWQIFRIQFGEAALISLVALLSGPIFGIFLVRALALVGPLAGVGEANWPLTVTGAAWLAAAVGAIACIVGLMLPVGPAVRRSIVSHQQDVARAAKPAWWQRAYLDVFVLAIGLILLWRLHIYGGIVGRSSGSAGVDWLLLLSPLALLLGTGTILLRLFPLVVRFLAFLSSRGRGLPAALAMWQVARNPTHVARLVLLLTLAMALGILSTGLNATLDVSEFERAYYSAGSDLRLVSNRFVPLSQVDNLANIGSHAGVWRGRGSVALGRLFGGVDVLAVEPFSFASLTIYRDDFAARPMGNLLGELVVAAIDAQPVTPLPDIPARIGVWVWSPPDPEPTNAVTDRERMAGDSDLDRVGLRAKLQTTFGEMLTIELRPSETDGYPEGGWRYFSGDIPRQLDNSYPLSLHSLWLQNRMRTEADFIFYSDASFVLALDDLTVTDAETGKTAVIDSFEDLTRVWATNLEGRPTVYEPMDAHSGRARLGLSFFLPSLESTSISLVGPANRLSVPALASPLFLEATKAEVGETVNILVESAPVNFTIVGTLNYFPTLYENERAGFLVTTRDPLLAYLNRFSFQPVNVNEVLIASSDGVGGDTPDEAVRTAASRVANVSQVVEAGNVRATIKADPMALGLRSVTYFGYVLTTALSLVGFATYFYMSARQREATYAVLRSIGLSPRQLYGMLVLEQIILIIFGLTLGTALGVILNQITLPGLPITLGDRAPIPPFRVQSDWLAVGRIYLTLTVAFLLSLGFATFLLLRTQLHRILRIGEE